MTHAHSLFCTQGFPVLDIWGAGQDAAGTWRCAAVIQRDWDPQGGWHPTQPQPSSPLLLRAQLHVASLRWRLGLRHRHNKPLFLFPLSPEPFLSHIPGCLALPQGCLLWLHNPAHRLQTSKRWDPSRPGRAGGMAALRGTSARGQGGGTGAGVAGGM